MLRKVKYEHFAFFNRTNQTCIGNAKYGCLIWFDKKKLIDGFSKEDGFRHKTVKYVNQPEFKRLESELKLEDIPFIKQKRYEKEEEYRLVWKGSKKTAQKISIPIKDSIKIINISGNIEKGVFESLKEIINKKIKSPIKVSYSRIFHNKILTKKLRSLL